MNIILATDAVTPPLTGIGRYTWELGTRLPALVAPDTLRFISRGRWVDTLATQLTQAPARAAFRRSVLRSRLAAMAYALGRTLFFAYFPLVETRYIMPVTPWLEVALALGLMVRFRPQWVARLTLLRPPCRDS